MSIGQELLSAIQNGQIVRLKPLVPDFEYRRLYLVSGLYSEIMDNDGDDEHSQRMAALRASLEIFITSSTLDRNYIKFLDPESKGVIEILNKRPKPSLRVFGMFIEEKKLLLTHFAIRKQLGGWKSYPFKQEIQKCRQTRSHILPNIRAVTGDIKDLI